VGGAVLCVALLLRPACAAEPSRIALLPLRMNAEKQMLYLRDGLYDMLVARLASSEGLDPLSRAAVMRLIPSPPVDVTEDAARELGRRLRADVIVFGSATLFGEGVSIDLKLVDVRGVLPTQAFFGQAADAGGVIPCVAQLAADIRRWTLPDTGPDATARHETPPEPAPLTRANAAPPAAVETPPSLVRSLPPAPPAARPPAAAGRSPAWTVQVAALRNEAEALRICAALRQKDFPARVERAEVGDTGVWFRVRVLEFPSAAAARETLDRLRREGYPAMAFPIRSVP
jgi:TolB-like protein